MTQSFFLALESAFILFLSLSPFQLGTQNLEVILGRAEDQQGGVVGTADLHDVTALQRHADLTVGGESDILVLELDLDAVSSDVAKYQKKSDSKDDFVLDLEDMDLDLDLNEPKKKS